MLGRTISHYRILEKLGGGGMGVVYKAEDTKLGRTVALKFLAVAAASPPPTVAPGFSPAGAAVAPGFSPADVDVVAGLARQPEGGGVKPPLQHNLAALERFKREAHAASALNHPNICTIYDIDTHDGQPFIVMELVQGKTLGQLIARHGLPVSEALKLAVQMAAALAKAHSAGIVHRDLKPTNVMVTDDGLVKVLDFGLAKLTEAAPTGDAETAVTVEPITEEGMIVGTVGYMSPEQAEGKPVDARSDIFSFGSVLYEILSGQRAFQGETKASTIAAVLKEEPKPLNQIVAALPHEVERLVKQCLRKDREHRFQHMDDLKVALENLKEESDSGELVETPPVGAGLVPAQRGRPRGAPLRRRAAFTLSAIVLLAGLLVGLNLGGLRDRLVTAVGARRAVPPPKIESLAVLPLANLSGDPQQEYFADGMTEELITSLSKIKTLKVISRTSAMQYKGAKKPLPQIGRELGVDAVIEGSVLRAEGRVRITAQLIHAASDRHLWAESYDRDLRDILGLQSEVARAIATEIRLELTPQEQASLAGKGAVNPEAYEAYLRGRHYAPISAGPEGQLKGIQYYQQAIQKDPSFALAYAKLAHCYDMLAYLEYPPAREFQQRARAAAQKALDLDPQMAEAHMIFADQKYWAEWDWHAGLAGFRRAAEMDPGSFDALAHLGYGLEMQGRFEEALAVFERARQLDPVSPGANSWVAGCLYNGHRDQLAIEQYRKMLQLDPDDAEAYHGLGSVYESLGKYDEAIASYLKSATSGGDTAEEVQACRDSYKREGIRGYWRKRLEDTHEQAKRQRVSPLTFASLYAHVGDKEQALRGLEKAYQEHAPSLVWLKASRTYDPLRSDPRFQAILRRMNFPP